MAIKGTNYVRIGSGRCLFFAADREGVAVVPQEEQGETVSTGASIRLSRTDLADLLEFLTPLVSGEFPATDESIRALAATIKGQPMAPITPQEIETWFAPYPDQGAKGAELRAAGKAFALALVTTMDDTTEKASAIRRVMATSYLAGAAASKQALAAEGAEVRAGRQQAGRSSLRS